MTFGGEVGANDRRFSPGEEINQILREELDSANITSTPKRAASPIYTKRRSSVLSKQDEPLLRRLCLMWLMGVEQLEASKCQEGVLLTQERVCPRVL